MKKNIVVILCSTLILLVGGFLIYSKFFTEDKNIVYEDLDKYTYYFTGKSEHFSFENGKVYFSETDQNMVINKFKMNKKISNIDKLDIKISFRNKFWGSKSLDENGNVKKFLINAQFGEWGKLENSSEGHDSDAFLETTKKSFKEDFKMTIDYCTKTECKSEEFVLTYIDK